MGVHVLEYTRKVGLRLKLNKESKLGIKKANFEMRDICCQLSTNTKITKIKINPLEKDKNCCSLKI